MSMFKMLSKWHASNTINSLGRRLPTNTTGKTCRSIGGVNHSNAYMIDKWVYCRETMDQTGPL